MRGGGPAQRFQILQSNILEALRLGLRREDNVQPRGEQPRGAEVAEGGGRPREQQRHQVERRQDEDESLREAAAVVGELAAERDGGGGAAEEQQPSHRGEQPQAQPRAHLAGKWVRRKVGKWVRRK
eukprot:scaffold45519_cov59-Phaeocystis_antarctica.AAC.2